MRAKPTHIVLETQFLRVLRDLKEKTFILTISIRKANVPVKY